jgi:hypothetical protein
LAQLSETSLAKRSSEPADTSAEFSAGAAAANDEARTRQGRCSKDHPEGISAPEQTRKLRGRWRPESAGGAVVEIMQNDLRLLATRGAARRARAELLRLLESIFDAPNQGKVASFEELRGRHVKALASLGKFFRMTGARGLSLRDWRPRPHGFFSPGRTRESVRPPEATTRVNVRFH